MRTNLLTYPILLILISVVSCVGDKSDLSWNEQEIEIIDANLNSIMPLQTVESNADSLFLRKKSNPLTFDDVKSEYFKKLTHQMLLTVTNPLNQGVGIAAPQVGISRNLIAVQRVDKSDEPFEFYVNPQILYYSNNKQLGWEGCLSVPNKRGEVERATTITIEYNDIDDFSLRRDTIEGFTSIIFQHEIDHLNGILYIDRADTLISKL